MTAPPARPRRRRAVNASGGITEDRWQRIVNGLLDFYGWRYYHTHDSRRSAAGFPDLVAVRGPRLIFAELKPDEESRRVSLAVANQRPAGYRTRDLTEEQTGWLLALEDVADAVRGSLDGALEDVAAGAVGVEVYLWRPRDFDTVVEVLARGSGMSLDAGLDVGRNLGL